MTTKAVAAEAGSPTPSVEDPAEPARWRWALGIITGVTLLQLVVGAITPLDGDETYYWEWSRRLALGYFDHPPMIAYLIRIGRLLAGDTALGIRLIPILANLAAMAIVLLLARRLGNGGTALRAALAMACLPIISAWLLLATPDPPLFLANAAALYAVVRAVQSPATSGEALRWWAAAGGLLGVALLSKEMAVLLPLGVLAAMATHPALRQRLREPGPYLACLIALIVFAPLVWWNATHHWPVRFQMQHGFGAPRGTAVGRELELIAGQAGMAAGILFVLLVIAVIRAIRNRESTVGYLLATVTVTAFALFSISALRRRVEANWPLTGFTPAVVLFALISGGSRWRSWRTAGYALGGTLVTLAYLHMLVPIFPRRSGGDMVRRGHGWRAIATRVSALEERPAVATGRKVWVAGNTFQDASELAFYLPRHPTVFSLNLDSRSNQYALWPQFTQLARPGDDLILVRGGGAAMPSALRLLTPEFESVRLADQIGPSDEDPEMPARDIWLLSGWRGTWPGSPVNR
jgi:4-amino-4-deoxy-L-arabinose transferase-like glycosyltransferase